MHPTIEFKMSGRFRLRVLKDGKPKSDTGFFTNIITNSGLNRYGAGGTCWLNCYAGTGNATPAAGDISLQNPVGWTQTKTTSSGVSSAGGYGWRRNVWTFAAGGATGNIAEIATGWENGTSLTGIFSRALVRDSGGTPTTITVLADEQLEVTWELRFYWPTADATGTITNSGNKGGTYSWTARAAQAGDIQWAPDVNGSGIGVISDTGSQIFYGGALGPITGGPTGTQLSSEVAAVAYVPGTYRKETKINLSLAQGNAGTAKCMTVRSNGSGFRFQFEITPGITKTADDTVSITLFVSWARR